jgi:2-haloacid dehalogenase
MPPRYEWIFLDADNTLFDYDRAEATALEAAFRHFGFAYGSDVLRTYREINRQVWADFEEGKIDKATLQTTRFAKLMDAHGNQADATAFNAFYLGIFAESGCLIDGAADVCATLSRQCSLVIATNGISRVQQRRLDNSGLTPYITRVVVSEDTGYQKPQPGFFEYAFRLCGIEDKSKVLMVGDSLSSDIKGGINAGIKTCWYNPAGLITEELNPDYEIRTLSELYGIIL